MRNKLMWGVVAVFVLAFGFLVVEPTVNLFWNLKSLPTAEAQVLPTHVKQSSPPVHRQYWSDKATVNLPHGQKFIGFLPRDMNHSTPRPYDLYMTEKRPAGERPRHLTIWGPGSTPHSWEVQFYIQEH